MADKSKAFIPTRWYLSKILRFNVEEAGRQAVAADHRDVAGRVVRLLHGARDGHHRPARRYARPASARSFHPASP